jgi:PAS domain S-box-containing protein
MLHSAVGSEMPDQAPTSAGEPGGPAGASEADRVLAVAPQPAGDAGLLDDSWFRTIVANLPLALYATDAEGRLTYFNRAAARFAGREPRLGRDRWCVSHRLFLPDGAPLAHEDGPVAVALRERRSMRGVEALAERPDGSRVPFISAPTPLHDGQGRLAGALNLLIDLSERGRAGQGAPAPGHELADELQTAIERGQLRLHYQPVFEAAGALAGFEALARWAHPERGAISPAEFIPVAEQNGLILPLAEHLLRQACAEAASWPNRLRIAVNVSPLQFRHGDLPGLIETVLAETGLAPERLELEITEGVMVTDFDRAMMVLHKIKALGVRIALDDFGTGYSSLSYLHLFPLSTLKIDRSFVANLGVASEAAAITRAVIALGHALGIEVVAEGVETREQLDFLIDEGCNYMQGYMLGRPLPAEQYADLTGRKG